MHPELVPLLRAFRPITLAEMDGVKLLDRTDTKFVFNLHKLPQVLQSLAEHYKILEVNGINENRYESLYFDTPDFKLYMDHHNGRTNRYKIRYRKYVDSDLVFFEIKNKNNKGRTIKSRIRRDRISEMIEGRSVELIHQKAPFCPGELQSKLWVNYSRITFVNKFTAERLTIDLDLLLKTGEQELKFENLVIAEVKQEGPCFSPFAGIMKTNHVREGSISKYCFGVISLIADIKKNNFKPSLLTMNRVSNMLIQNQCE